MDIQKDPAPMSPTAEAYMRTLCRLPEACALEVLVDEHVVESGYVREHISYLTSPGVRVPAYLLRPELLNGSAAAVVCFHQHNGEYHLGKSEPAGLAGNPDMFHAVELCKRGFVALVPDMEGFEERQRSPEDAHFVESDSGPTGSANERFIALRYLMRGSTLQARYVWDMARAVDYLESRSDVDAHRIGAIGHSMGGQQVCWSMLFDSRIKAGVCSCGVSTFEANFQHGIVHSQSAYVPGFQDVGDMDTLVSTLAPTPFLMTAGTLDPLFPIDGVRQIARAATKAYETAGDHERFQYVEFEGKHAFPPEIRARAYRWLARWLD